MMSRSFACLATLALLAALALPARAQAPLFLINEDTQVRGVAFKFLDTRTFEDDQLELQIATQGPGLLDKVKRVLPLLSAAEYPFFPVELQRDVVRLRRFYRQNGFLSPSIDYGASQLDTTSNTIRIVFSIQEGPPLIIQDVGFFGPEGRYAAQLFDGEERAAWIRFRDRNTFQTGSRFTEFDLIRLQDQVLAWLKDRGYAFARVSADTTIYAATNTVDIRMQLDPGPVATIGAIQVVGNTSVADKVVLRELPFKVGDRFSASKLTQGQREVFALNLFRLAVADVPPQPRDSSVAVRLAVNEAKLRTVSAQTGYTTELGATLQGQWQHRNFFGGARTFTAGFVAESGFGARVGTGVPPPRRYRLDATLRQPYLFINGLSGSLGPFVEFRSDPLTQSTERFFDIDTRELGLRGELLYSFLPFRFTSLSYTFSRPLRLSETVTPPPDSLGPLPPEALSRLRDVYSKSIISLTARLGRVNDYLKPRRGFDVRPSLETGGAFLGSDVEYQKASIQGVVYVPVTARTHFAARLFVGRIWPRGASTDQFTQPVEDRFDEIRFYAGGANDVRGYDLNQVGPDSVRLVYARNSDGTLKRDENGNLVVSAYEFEPVGGLAKLAGNLELRMPFPGLSSAWRTAAFLDFGQVSEGSYDPSKLRYGVGGGIRYETLVGYIRLDVGFKVNPSATDLASAEDVYRFRRGEIEALPEAAFWKRVKFHLSIGQAF